MLSSAIITFREMLEISLIIAMVSAATVNIKSNKYYVSIGVILGTAFSVIIAMSFNYIVGLAHGHGIDFLNIAVLLFSVIMLNWTIFWMRKNIKHFKEKARHQTCYAISLIVAVAIIREGAEIILYFYSMILNQHDIMNVIIGFFGGALTGALFGFLFYFGLSAMIKKYIFAVSNWMLIILAASIASHIPDHLILANIADIDMSALWDSSAIISDNSFLGEILRVTIGYHAKPYKMQLAFYIASLAISLGFYHQDNRE